MTDPFRDQLQAALGHAYRLERELTGGGMSRVFVARERALDRDVVVKVLPPELAAGVNRDRFRREIQLAAQLQHPHIVPLLSAGESGELLYYTMPFIAGESLKDALAARGKLPVRDVVRIVHDVVDALAYAHERGIIHRDIKPANVLMSGSHAVITDFGVAKALSVALPLTGVTTAGVAIGTPAYMAPEQLAADPAADHRVDIYAVGLLAYELLTGESPFASTSPAATMAAQLTRVPEPLSERSPEVPAELSAVIMRCLEKQPSARYSSAREFQEILDRVSTPQGGVFSAPAILRSRTGVSRRYVALLAVLFTIAIGSALALTWNRRHAAERTAMRATVPIGDTAQTSTFDVIPSAPTPPEPRAPGAPTPGASTRAGASATIALTPAESLAIARAVQQRMVEQPGREVPASAKNAGGLDSVRRVLEAVLIDSVQRARVEIYQALLDSMRREIDSLQRRRTFSSRDGAEPWERSIERSMERLRSLPGIQGRSVYVMPPTPAYPSGRMDSAAAHRVAVSAQFINGTPFSAIDAVAAAAADSLRAHLKRHGGYEVVVARAPGSRAYGDPLRVAQSSNAGVGLGGLIVARRDSVYLQVHVGDLRRGNGFRAFKGAAAPLDDPLRGADALWNDVIAWIAREEGRGRGRE